MAASNSDATVYATESDGLIVSRPKRQKLNATASRDGSGATALSHGDYAIGWICALPKEMSAATAMLDSMHQDLARAENDTNTYVLGRIAEHNVVIACLPSGYYGNNNAAAVASNMRRTFPCLRLCLMVGIGGGAPGRADIRLGDVVVSEAVLQYDLGKTVGQGCFVRTNNMNKPPVELLTAIAKLRAKHDLAASQIPSIVSKMLERHPAMAQYCCRSSLQDCLFDNTYDHVQPADLATNNCELCDTSRLVIRPPRDNPDLKIHYGTIASGNQVIKDGRTRNKLALELNAICFEMEGAGLMDSFAGLVIRGICDYCDSHKNKQWQEVAAASAAAYAKELLLIIPTDRSRPMPVADMHSAAVDVDRQQKLLNFLEFEQIDARRSTIKANYSTTCHWLLIHPKYLDWLDPKTAATHHGFLWLRGGPGTGKSTIMNFAYKQSAQDKQKITISFFFNARGDILERSIHGMYRSLLHQLLLALPSLFQVFDEPQHRHSTHQLYTSNMGDEQPVWQVAVLQDLLRSALARLGAEPLTIFVDALDECPNDQVEEMVEYFEDAGRRAAANGTRLTVCFSSRYYPQIQIQCGHKIDLEDQDGHEKDIATYIRSKLKVGTGKAADEVKARVQAKARGIFIWVVLVVDILKKEYSKGRIFVVKKRLAALPAELSDLFREILSRDQVNLEDFRLCIQWMLFAKRPLKVEEYYFAMVSKLNPDELQEWDPDEVTPEAIGRFVISSSKGLAEMTKSKVRTVQFIHESVREFFLKDGLKELWPHTNAAEFESTSHIQLQHCCYAYFRLASASRIAESLSIPHPLPKASSGEAKLLRGSISVKFPFLEYATRHVLHHANAAADALSQEEFLVEFPIKDWIFLDNIFENFGIRRHTPDASLIYILAEFNFAKLITCALRLDAKIDIEGERYHYPLFAALANSNQDAVKALLQVEVGHRLDQFFTRLDYGDGFKAPKDQTPLWWAAARGHEDVVHLLVARGSDVEAVKIRSKTPLMSAAENGHTGTVRLLLENNANVTAKDTYGRTALLWAVFNKHEAAAQLLLAKGSDVNVTDLLSRSPLIHAAKNGHAGIIRLLLDNNANVTAKDTNGWTALLWAVVTEHEVATQLLLAKGSDVNVADSLSRSPLIHATETGHTGIIRLLLDNNANVTAKDTDGWTALSRAVMGGCESIVRLLLENGADIDARCRGVTPLMVAVGQGHEAIIQLLLKNGADTTARDANGDTAMIRAVKRGGCAAAVPLLFDHGANLSMREGDVRIMRLLLERGADITAIDSQGRNAMTLAIEQGHEAIVQLLELHQSALDARKEATR